MGVKATKMVEFQDPITWYENWVSRWMYRILAWVYIAFGYSTTIATFCGAVLPRFVSIGIQLATNKRHSGDIGIAVFAQN